MTDRDRPPALPLSNPRWESFCQAYVRGETAGNAAASYRAAGYSSDARARNSAYGLMRVPAIRARIARLQMDMQHIEEGAMQTAMERLALRKEAVLSELAKVGFANIADYVRQTPEGEWAVDFSALERDKGAGMVEFHMTESGEGAGRKRSVKIKMGGKVVALALLGKHLGLFVDRKEQDHESVRNASTEELKQQLAEYTRKLADVGGAAGAPASSDGRRGAVPPPGPDQA